MQDPTAQPYWWSSASIRIVNKSLDPSMITNMLKITPSFAYSPGESKIHFQDCRSAGYWCGCERVDYPIRPDAVIAWAEEVAKSNESFFRQLLDSGCGIDIYVAIHANVLNVGFQLPKTPTLAGLDIKIGIEFFGR